MACRFGGCSTTVLVAAAGVGHDAPVVVVAAPSHRAALAKRHLIAPATSTEMVVLGVAAQL